MLSNPRRLAGGFYTSEYSGRLTHRCVDSSSRSCDSKRCSLLIAKGSDAGCGEVAVMQYF